MKQKNIILFLLCISFTSFAYDVSDNIGRAYIDTATFLLTRLGASLIHETGHYATAYVLNSKPHIDPKIIIYGSSRYATTPERVLANATIHAMGPLAEALWSYGIYKLAQKLPNSSQGKNGMKFGAISGMATSFLHLLPLKLTRNNNNFGTDCYAILEIIKAYKEHKKKPSTF